MRKTILKGLLAASVIHLMAMGSSLAQSSGAFYFDPVTNENIDVMGFKLGADCGLSFLIGEQYDRSVDADKFIHKESLVLAGKNDFGFCADTPAGMECAIHFIDDDSLIKDLELDPLQVALINQSVCESLGLMNIDSGAVLQGPFASCDPDGLLNMDKKLADDFSKCQP